MLVGGRVKLEIRGEVISCIEILFPRDSAFLKVSTAYIFNQVLHSIVTM